VLARFDKAMLHVVLEPHVDLVVPVGQDLDNTVGLLNVLQVDAHDRVPLVLLGLLVDPVVAKTACYDGT
jgi:hypothetical protein